MRIQFYPYDFEYKVKRDKVYVYLYSKLADGTKLCVIHQHQPYFYASLNDLNKEELEKRLKELTIDTKSGTARIVRWEQTEKELLGKKQSFLKIYANFPKAVPPLAKRLHEWGIECYEKDILFVHRYLRDVGITPMTLVEAEGEFANKKFYRIPVFHAEKVSQSSKRACKDWKILAIDIETYAETRQIDPKKNPILMIAFYGENEKGETFRKVLAWKKFEHKLDYLEYVSDEVELLERFREVILDYRPDIITGYFSDGFDFPYIKVRADKYHLKLDLGLDRSELITGTKFREGEAKIKGILHLDMLKFIKYIFGKNLKTDSFTLDAVSEELLGHKKHDVNISELAHVWDSEPEKLPDFCEYNLHDSHLAFKLCRSLLFDMIEFTKIIGLPTFDVIRMRFSRLVENYILQRAVEQNVLAPNKPGNYELEQRMEESIQGAFVKEPIPGLYENMVVFDFRSLYPTIISAHNIGPEGLRCTCCRGEPHVPERDEFWFCQQERKFLPSVLERLILRRVDLKRMIKEEKPEGKNKKFLEARSYALKILANSFYGYLGFFGARWYCLECAASTTAYARNYIKRTIVKAQEKGFDVIYADTDSCFLLLGDKIIDQAMEFMNEINFDLPGHMELEYEGNYPRGIFVQQKGSEKGAKKKYALIDGEGRVKITGFETVRRNWSAIAREVQQEVLQLVLEDKAVEAVDYVKDIVRQLKEGKVPLEKVVIRTQITKKLSAYSSIGPHVAVAVRLQKKGITISPGTMIEYIIAKGTGLIRERAKTVDEVKMGEYDFDYYLNNQIIPAVNSIFAVLGYKEDEIFKKSSQTGLGKYF